MLPKSARFAIVFWPGAIRWVTRHNKANAATQLKSSDKVNQEVKPAAASTKPAKPSKNAGQSLNPYQKP